MTKEKDDNFYYLVKKKIKTGLSVEEEDQLGEYLEFYCSDGVITGFANLDNKILNLRKILEKYLVLDFSKIKAGDIVLTSYKKNNYEEVREEIVVKVNKSYIFTSSGRFSLKTGQILGCKSPFSLDYKIISIQENK